MSESSISLTWASAFIFFFLIQHLMHAIDWFCFCAIIEFQAKASTNFDTMTLNEEAASALWTKKTSFVNWLFSDVENDMKCIWDFQSCEIIEIFEIASFRSETLSLTSLRKLKSNMLKTTLLKLKLFRLEPWANKIIISYSKTLFSMS